MKEGSPGDEYGFGKDAKKKLNILVPKWEPRRKAYEQTFEILSAYAKKKSLHISLTSLRKISTTMEASIYENVRSAAITQNIHLSASSSIDGGLFVIMYSTAVFHMLVNLDAESTIGSDYLVSGILNFVMSREGHAIDPKMVGAMNDANMAPAKSEKERMEIELRSQQKIEKKFTEMYVCKNCKHKKAEVKTIQTRSGDEGYSLDITCLVCTAHWVMHT